MSKVEKSITSSLKGTVKVVKQRNHDGGRVPPELSEYADQPLYILIALWGVQQKTWIGHKQVSAAFSITERRASFQLSYILRKKEIIQCQTRKVKVSGTRRLCHQVMVEQVNFSGVTVVASQSEKVSSTYRKHSKEESYGDKTRATV